VERRRLPHDQVRHAALSSDGTRVASCGWDGTVRLWEAGTGQELCRVSDKLPIMEAVAFSPDGKQVIAAGFGLLRAWDAKTGAEGPRLAGPGGRHRGLV